MTRLSVVGLVSICPELVFIFISVFAKTKSGSYALAQSQTETSTIRSSSLNFETLPVFFPLYDTLSFASLNLKLKLKNINYPKYKTLRVLCTEHWWLS